MRFNTITKQQPTAASRHKTVNRAGGEAFKQDPQTELASILVTNFLNDQFYRKAEDTISELKPLIEANPKFAAKAAVFARNEFGMRSISHVVAGEIAANVKGETWTRPFFRRVVRRPDDITETLSYYLGKYGKPIPNAMKRGFADKLAWFDEYRLGKYKQKKAALSLIDAVNLCHPKATPALDALMNGTLAPPETWEVKLSAAGSDAEEKARVWHDLISEKKLGYFALLRNLRNIMQQADDDTVAEALTQLVDGDRIRKSLVLPFRFLTAIKAIQDTSSNHIREALVALSDAIDASLDNVPTFDGKTLIVIDTSGSMTWGNSDSPIKIASVFGAALYKANEADLMLFATAATYFNPNPTDATLTIAQAIERRATGGRTNFHAPFQTANKAYDRIIILTDMQGWVGYNAPTSTFDAYCNTYAANPHVYNFDLTGYGSLQLPRDRVFEIAGFSDKVFDLMKLLEEDRKAFVHRIEQTHLA